MEAFQVLLRQLGEWVRIRGALKQFMNNVKVRSAVVPSISGTADVAAC